MGLLLLFILSTNLIYAQLDSTSIITEDAIDNILIESEDETDNEEIVNRIEDLIQNPIDINTTDVFELSKLPYIDIQSAERIIEHRNKFGHFFSPGELFAIREIR